ncbi:MAG: hypothetical protein WC758_03630 [Candidatus Woesearchaeota archaeon]|jgi:hypothetical protein
MKLYRFSPIKDKKQLLKAIKHIHFSCYKLCHQSFGEYLPNAGNIGVFCHYDEEYNLLIKIKEELTEPSDDLNKKYFKLHKPITIKAKNDIPKTTYTHLYIRKPDIYRAQIGDLDFFLEPEKYDELKKAISNGKIIKGARIFPRADLDMIELYDPNIDALAYVSTKMMTEKVKVKQN